jgi:hypothetical protein
MMSQLGRMLTEFYFPEEASLIRRRVEPSWQRGEWSQAIEDRAVGEVLGLSYEQLGVGVTKVWGLPDSLRRAIARPEGEPPTRAVDSAADRLRWCVQASSELAQALMQAPTESAGQQDLAIGDRFARALNLPKDQFETAVRSAQSHLQSMSTDLGIDLKADSKARRLLPQALAVPTGNINPATIVTAAMAGAAPNDATMVMPAPSRPGAAARQRPARRRRRIERPHAGARGRHLQRDERAGRRHVQAERGAAHDPADDARRARLPLRRVRPARSEDRLHHRPLRPRRAGVGAVGAVPRRRQSERPGRPAVGGLQEGGRHADLRRLGRQRPLAPAHLAAARGRRAQLRAAADDDEERAVRADLRRLRDARRHRAGRPRAEPAAHACATRR